MPSAPPLSEFSGSALDLYWNKQLEVVQFYNYRLSRSLFVCLSRVFFHFFFADSFPVVFLLYDAVVFEKAKSMTRGCWQILDCFISCSYTLRHSGRDPCASWGSGISFKDATSGVVQICCFDSSDASIQHLYESR